MPVEGDAQAFGGWVFEVIDMDGRRIDKLLARREQASDAFPSA